MERVFALQLANDDRKPAIVTTTSRKRVKLLRADKRPAERVDDPEAAAKMRAWWSVSPQAPQAQATPDSMESVDDRYGHLCHADRGYRHRGQCLSAVHATAHG